MLQSVFPDVQLFVLIYLGAYPDVRLFACTNDPNGPTDGLTSCGGSGELLPQSMEKIGLWNKSLQGKLLDLIIALTELSLVYQWNIIGLTLSRRGKTSIILLWLTPNDFTRQQESSRRKRVTKNFKLRVTFRFSFRFVYVNFVSPFYLSKENLQECALVRDWYPSN